MTTVTPEGIAKLIVDYATKPSISHERKIESIASIIEGIRESALSEGKAQGMDEAFARAIASMDNSIAVLEQPDPPIMHAGIEDQSE